MSIIGSAPGIRLGSTLEIVPVTAVGASDRSATAQVAVPAAAPSPAASVAASPAAVSTAYDAGTAPIDQARVASIKKAIQNNSYPLTPAKIGDAMIAAGMLLRMPK